MPSRPDLIRSGLHDFKDFADILAAILTGGSLLDITTKTSLVGFLLALSALSMPDAGAAVQAAASSELTIEARLTRLTTAVQQRATQLPDAAIAPDRVAIGFADGSGREWVNGRGGGGWADGHSGDWVNRNNWRNGWADGGGFWNRY